VHERFPDRSKGRTIVGQVERVRKIAEKCGANGSARHGFTALPGAHRLVGATSFQTAGAGHLRQGDARRFAEPDEDGESSVIGHGMFPRAQRARCCVRPRDGGRRRVGSEGGHAARAAGALLRSLV